MARISDLPQVDIDQLDGNEQVPIAMGGETYRSRIIDIGNTAAAEAKAWAEGTTPDGAQPTYRTRARPAWDERPEPP